MEKILSSKGFLAGFAITLIGLVLRYHGIAQQPPLPDELGVALSAVNYVENGQYGPTMWYHPNLRNIIQYAIGEYFGHGPLALRGVSLLTGALSVSMLGLLSQALIKSRFVSLLAAFLLAIEQVHIAFSRQAIQETWTIFLILLGVLLFVYYYQTVKIWLLPLAGVVFGLGVSSKFHALFPLMLCLGVGLRSAWQRRSPALATYLCACLIVMPCIVYLLTFIPWFGRGYGVIDWVVMQKAVFAQMVIHQGNPMDQVIDRAAWQWFLKPVGYANFVIVGQIPFLTVAFSNPFVWLLVLPSTLSVLWGLSRKKYVGEQRNGVILILLLFVTSYLPLAFSPRPIWLISSLAVIPFAFMIVALVAERCLHVVRWGRLALSLYLMVILVSSLLLYPLAVGKGQTYSYLQIIAERYRPAFEGQ